MLAFPTVLFEQLMQCLHLNMEFPNIWFLITFSIVIFDKDKITFDISRHSLFRMSRYTCWSGFWKKCMVLVWENTDSIGYGVIKSNLNQWIFEHLIDQVSCCEEITLMVIACGWLQINKMWGLCLFSTSLIVCCLDISLVALWLLWLSFWLMMTAKVTHRVGHDILFVICFVSCAFSFAICFVGFTFSASQSQNW